MNIEGVVRELPLFEPPIPPGLLVQAAATGVDISSAVNDLSAPLPFYRFQVLSQKASELAAEVKGLGAALLSALEKRDAENLALLRAGLEVQILEAAENIKVQQKEEALQAQTALERGRDLTNTRLQYYARLLAGNDEGIAITIEGADVVEALEAKDLGLNNEEISQLNLAVAAIVLGNLAVLPQVLAGLTSLIPSFTFGVAGAGGSPLTSISFGGGNLSGAASAAAGVLQQLASLLDRGASIAGTVGGFRRRAEEWGQQILLARGEYRMISAQIEAAKIRVAIAEKEIQVHRRQIEQSRQVQDLIEQKYTSQELYGWMISQLATVYFQTYQLAYDLAKRAERAFRHELGLLDTNYIQFGYWDNLKKGLLSGERLLHDVKRMEIAYLEQNKRELEITKHVSLALLDPLALLQLRQHASCEVEIPEVLYDLDFPGHYMRRIKSVSLTVPCVTGPYTGISSTLTLLRHSVRTLPSLTEPVQEALGAVQAIATSSGQNDSGLFQLDFRDERYLPFERAGAVSRWRLDLPGRFRQFDYDTITDAILHISYTARDGGAVFRNAVDLQLQDRLEGIISAGEMEGLTQLFSAKHDFPNQWHQFLHPVAMASAQTLRLELGEHRFPFMFKGRTIALTAMHLLLKPKRGFSLGDGGSLAFTLTRDGGASFESAWQPAGSLVAGLPYANPFAGQSHELGTWIIEVSEDAVSSLPAPLRVEVDADDVTHQRLNPDAFDDVLVIVQYGVT
jgi:Tc toxin complex TcA C-terminal TcB-binding domain